MGQLRWSVPTRVALRLGLLLTSVIAVIAVAEVVARLSYRSPEERRVEPDPVERLDPAGLEDIELRAVVRPNVLGLLRGIVVRTNSRGLRGPEYSRVPAPGTFRIGITGDSVTMALGVDERETYSARLEDLLNAGELGVPAASRWERFEVVNVGLTGINVDQAISRLERATKDYVFDLLVYGFTINDLLGPHYNATEIPSTSKRIRNERRKYARSSSYLLRAAWPGWITLRERLWPDPGSYRSELNHNFFERPLLWDRFQKQLARLHELATNTGVCGHVFIHTTLSELGWLHPDLPIYAKIARSARGLELTVTDSYWIFAGRYAEDFWISVFDPHPNAAGHALLARALLDGLSEIPASCWHAARPAPFATVR